MHAVKQGHLFNHQSRGSGTVYKITCCKQNHVIKTPTAVPKMLAQQSHSITQHTLLCLPVPYCNCEIGWPNCPEPCLSLYKTGPLSPALSLSAAESAFPFPPSVFPIAVNSYFLMTAAVPAWQ